jgi:methyl-accepting chemotaxis protein
LSWGGIAHVAHGNSRESMERSGPSIEIKIVLLVAAAVIVQDIILLAMYLAGAEPYALEAALGGVLVASLIAAAVWGNAVARAIRRLTRACFVAREGDLRVLAEPTRTDEIGELNAEINKLVVLVRELAETGSELGASTILTEAVSQAAPDILHSSHEILVSAKELKEGTSAELSLTRRIERHLEDAGALLDRIGRNKEGTASAEEIGAKLKSLGALARDVELLADAVVDEVARPEIDEASLARAVNGVRDAARTMADVASQAAGPLEGRRGDARAAAQAIEHLEAAEKARADAARVAELMDRSAATGQSEATRLASALRRLGVLIEAYEQRGRLERAGRI